MLFNMVYHSGWQLSQLLSLSLDAMTLHTQEHHGNMYAMSGQINTQSRLSMGASA